MARGGLQQIANDRMSHGLDDGRTLQDTFDNIGRREARLERQGKHLTPGALDFFAPGGVVVCAPDSLGLFAVESAGRAGVPCASAGPAARAAATSA